MKHYKYIDDTTFLYEIIISKGKGKLTKTAEQYIMFIPPEMTKKLNYKDPEDRKDCINYAILLMLTKWKKFDETKYNSPFIYFSELCKRALAWQFNQLNNKDLYRSISISTNIPI